MKSNLLKYIMLPMLLLLSSCITEEEFSTDASGNLEALWKIMDEHYCYFPYKQQTLGVDWQEVHERYKPQVAGADTYQLFEVLTQMIGELRDGHVNLSTGFDLGRNWSWKEDYPSNFSDTLYNKYIGTDYKISSGISYKILDDNIGYMYVPTFSNDFGEGNLDNILYSFINCRAIIIDIRNNGGGMITAAERLASRFTNEKLLVGYMRHKNGTGHEDFSDFQPQYVSPSKGFRWHKPVFVLTNRSVFSAANEFTKYMKAIGQHNGLCTIIGDQTGGGGGMPFNGELPNGWRVRFSACPMYDTDKQSTEHGILPDVQATLGDTYLQDGCDNIIETARSLVK